MTCPYVTARSNKSNKRSKGIVTGAQTASADAKIDDPVSMYNTFKRLRLTDNEFKAQLLKGRMEKDCSDASPAGQELFNEEVSSDSTPREMSW